MCICFTCRYEQLYQLVLLLREHKTYIQDYMHAYGYTHKHLHAYTNMELHTQWIHAQHTHADRYMLRSPCRNRTTVLLIFIQGWNRSRFARKRLAARVNSVYTCMHACMRMHQHLRVCVCVCARARAQVRACACGCCVRVRSCAFVHVCVCMYACVKLTHFFSSHQPAHNKQSHTQNIKK